MNRDGGDSDASREIRQKQPRSAISKIPHVAAESRQEHSRVFADSLDFPPFLA
jgi:hypothetical protein